MNEMSYGISVVRRSLLLCSMLVATCCSLWAQADGPPGPPPEGPPPGMQSDSARGPRVDRELKHLTQMLSLTDTQQTQVKALLTEQKQKFDAMPQETSAQETSGDPTAIHEKMRAIRDETNSRISALLNDDQKAKFAAWEERQKSMMGRRQRGNGDQPPPPPPDGGGSPPGL